MSIHNNHINKYHNHNNRYHNNNKDHNHNRDHSNNNRGHNSLMIVVVRLMNIRFRNNVLVGSIQLHTIKH